MTISTGTIVGYDGKFGLASVRLDAGEVAQVSIAALYGPSFMAIHKGREVRGIRVRVQYSSNDQRLRIQAAKEIDSSETA